MSSSQDHQPPEQSIEQPSAKLEPDNDVEEDENPIKFSIHQTIYVNDSIDVIRYMVNDE